MILVSQINGLFELDLSNCRIQFTHENNWFTSNVVAGYSLPEELPYDVHEFFLQYQSDNTAEYQTKFDVIFNDEGVLHNAKFEIIKILDHSFEFSIFYGYEEFPNWEKKLTELEIELINVADIRLHAKAINSRKYPEENYYFPLIHTDQYKKEDLNYAAFKGSYNLRGFDGEFLQNTINLETNEIFNQTILKPYMYWLSVLKLIINQAGFELDGEILDDPQFINMLVINSAKYDQPDRPESIEWVIGMESFTAVNNSSFLGFFYSEQEILHYGKFRIQGTIKQIPFLTSKVIISLNGIVVYQASLRGELSFDFTTITNQGSNLLTIHYGGDMRYEANKIKIIPVDLYDENGEIINYVIDPKVIDLRASLPEANQGDFIEATMKWGNYDFTIDGKKVIMNKIERILKRKRNAADWRKFESYSKERTTDSGKSFLLKFKDSGSDEVKNLEAYIDYEGIKIDALKKSKDSEEILININPLPMVLKNNSLSAGLYKDDESTIFAALRYPDTITDNRTSDPVQYLIPSVAENSYKVYLKFLINALQHTWNFSCSSIELKDFNIKQEIYAYGNNHFIKKITRDKLNGIEDINVEAYLIR